MRAVPREVSGPGSGDDVGGGVEGHLTIRLHKRGQRLGMQPYTGMVLRHYDNQGRVED
jgi:hypothetical protein